MYSKIIILIALLLIPVFSNAKSCKKYKSCAEVILDYPSGSFGGKDRDKDGIPCENVCHSKKQVEDLLNKSSSSNKKNNK
jgi:hypothetical protein